MAGEWIAIDLALDQKPEVQELIDTTGEPVEVVCFRLWKLWSWAAMHCADGTARMTLPRLSRTCGGDDAFWQAVAAVGWLEIDETAATVAVPGWDRRFSQAAKARLQHADRAKAYEGRNPGRKERAGPSGAQAPDDPAPERRRGDKRRSEFPPPPPREAAQPAEVWGTLRQAWNKGANPASRRRPWKPVDAPDGAGPVIEAAGWLDEALEAIPRLAGCRYFDSPVTLIQFTKPGFVRKVLGGQYDEKSTARSSRPPGDLDRRPAAQAAAEWQRSAADPEAARRRTEYLEAQARKRAGVTRETLDRELDDDTEAARAAVLAQLRKEGAA